jgi:ferritin-like metal-binding protein YciE
MEDNARTRDLFVTGLRNAHAMESQALSIMRSQLGRIKNYPDVARRLEQHITETEGQQRRLEAVLDSCGESRSGLKDAALSLGGTMAALGHTPAGDEILKDAFADFAFENYEIAAYTSLLSLAERLGEQSAVEPLRQSLEEERAMADWIEQNLTGLTEQFASLREAREPAKI